MWFWKKKKEKKNEKDGDKKKDEIKEPDEHEIRLHEMERELDRVMPGLGRMFREIERELERTMPEMLKMMEETTKEMQKNPGKQPMYRGIHIVIGPGGPPRIGEFGKTAGGKEKIIKFREPLVDVFDRGDEVVITAELPGVEKENVKVCVDGKTLEILARGDGPFKYKKALALEEFVDIKGSRAVFNNGILEITVKKSKTPAEGSIAIG